MRICNAIEWLRMNRNTSDGKRVRQGLTRPLWVLLPHADAPLWADAISTSLCVDALLLLPPFPIFEGLFSIFCESSTWAKNCSTWTPSWPRRAASVCWAVPGGLSVPCIWPALILWGGLLYKVGNFPGFPLESRLLLAARNAPLRSMTGVMTPKP